MTEVKVKVKEVKAVDARITETATKQKAVMAAVKQLVTINERAAAADAATAVASTQMIAVLGGQTTEGEQDVSVLLRERNKQQKLAAKIRDSAGIYARDAVNGAAALTAFVSDLTQGIELAEVSDEPKLGDDEEEVEELEEEEEVDA